MALTKTKTILLMLIGGLTAASPNIFRIAAMILLLLYIIRYKEDEGAMRMAAFVAVGYSVALFPSPWHALAAGAMLYLIYKRWEDAGFLGLLGGLSMVVAYMFYTFAEQKLGWLYGVRLFYTDPATSLILGYGLFYTGVAVATISTFLIFMRVAEETTKGYAVAIGGEEEMPKKKPKQLETVREKEPETEKKREAEEKLAREGQKKETTEEEKPAEEKKVKVVFPKSVEI
jgi:signal transduction histidine kinase